mmetsp:Transcript_28570/g.58389  ORF Transcript_28570/g.58389 Transcript_28570/m.58389 type:complete len:221 (+) Transcript_28570:646-1308(+)
MLLGLGEVAAARAHAPEHLAHFVARGVDFQDLVEACDGLAPLVLMHEGLPEPDLREEVLGPVERCVLVVLVRLFELPFHVMRPRDVEAALRPHLLYLRVLVRKERERVRLVQLVAHDEVVRKVVEHHRVVLVVRRCVVRALNQLQRRCNTLLPRLVLVLDGHVVGWVRVHLNDCKPHESVDVVRREAEHTLECFLCFLRLLQRGKAVRNSKSHLRRARGV